ncbi:hypothetical protein G5B40_20310 [Pikeienuella piscinae]|uniref:FecR protein domain-containing protein n=1 Tax=Pikeienuella piscinae TaxID=2748098 RepID=A0A7M3T6F3_9RHOB|nr:FecR domain-containing protein [Pikeienuella piscinae]QIE57584.1 hypothetical protein G5B40_20310 [Pikeienuella piscinae]
MKVFIVTLALALVGSHADSSEVGQAIGKTGAVTPAALAILANQRRDLSRDVEVRFGERIETTVSGNAGFVFDDKTRLYVAENSSIQIDSYVYEGNGRIDLSMPKGIFRLASGKIGGKNITVRTGIAAIGLRGTVISVGTDPSQTVIYVEQGGADVQVGRRSIPVEQGESLRA